MSLHRHHDAIRSDFSFPPTKVLHFFELSKEMLIFFMQKIVYVGEKM